MRMPISKQRNKHIQRVLIEAAKLATRESPELAMIRARELEKGNPQPSNARRSAEDGHLHARRRTQAAGLGACRTVPPHGGCLKSFPKNGKAKHQDS